MDSFSVDGLPIKELVTPTNTAELAGVLGEASANSRAVTPVGGGTKLAIGNVPAFVDLGLSTRKLTRILHYEPTDMTLSVESGIRFAELQTVLAERGQTLPIETPDDELATIGGLIATAMAGPRRLGSGTLRDLLIGISVAYPSGIIGKAGGLVVKNVTGFDLMRLHLGAYGTLGVVLSANFKVLPLARSESTLLSAPLTLEAALVAASAARQNRLRPISVELFAEGEAWRCVVRLEGRAETVALGIEAAKSVAAWENELRSEESKRWWKTYVQRQSLMGLAEQFVIRCGAEPKRSGVLAKSIQSIFARQDISPELFAISPGLGTVVITFNSQTVAAEAFARLVTELIGVAETVTVLKAPPEFKQGIDVWGAIPATIAVMRSLKAEFDGGNTLNPGRFVDRI